MIDSLRAEYAELKGIVYGRSRALLEETGSRLNQSVSAALYEKAFKSTLLLEKLIRAEETLLILEQTRLNRINNAYSLTRCVGPRTAENLVSTVKRLKTAEEKYTKSKKERDELYERYRTRNKR